MLHIFALSLCFSAGAKHHAIHLHGHDFAVLKTEYPEYSNITGYTSGHNKNLECPDEKMCRKMKWTKQQHFQLQSESNPTTVSLIF